MSNLSAVRSPASALPVTSALHNSETSNAKTETILSALPNQSNAAQPITDHKVQEIKTIVETEKQKTR
jgi:hypothetical protein